VVTFSGSYPAPANCAVTDTLTARATSVCGVAVTDFAIATCPVVATPTIEVTTECPAIAVRPGAQLDYTGTVRNTGGTLLTNIVVTIDRPVANTPVFTLATLAPGASAAFTGRFQVPDNCCVVSGTVRATGQGCDGTTASDTFTRTCTVLTDPRLVVTKICPTGILRPGDLLAFHGSVSNAGNITLVNVTVVNSQSTNVRPLLGPVTLLPGESLPYAGSYVIPEDFCGTDTVTASGRNDCTLLPVVDSVTTTCPVITAPPSIAITKDCPLVPTLRGGLHTYTGTVSNSGTVTLINVYVVDSQPTNPTPVLGPITLAPGASLRFTNSYIAPRCCCVLVDTLTARGEGRCSGTGVSATTTTVCPLVTTPSIAVVQDCPPIPIVMGSLYRFTGYVTNTGDATLTNVFVFGPQGTNAVLLGPVELAPGEAAAYSGTFLVPADTCSVSVSTIGRDVCGGSLVANASGCPVATSPRLELTQECPATPVTPGGLLKFRGTVRNAGDITLTHVVVVNSRSGSVPLFTAATFAPGAVAIFTGSYAAPTNCSTTSISTGTGRTVCGVAVTNTATSTCPILTTPSISVVAACPPSPAVPGGLMTFSGTVRNEGNITLTNVIVFGDRPAANTRILTIASLAPGASTDFTAAYAVAVGDCSLTAVFRAAGQDICSLNSVTNSAAVTCAVANTSGVAVTLDCPALPAAPGSPVTFSGTVRNTGSSTLTNVSVVGIRPSTNTPVHASISISGGTVTVSWPATPGSAYSVQYKSDLLDSDWTDLPGLVVAGSTTGSREDPIGSNGQRFYRVRTASGTPVVGPLTLAPGAVGTFSYTIAAPIDTCSMTGTVTVTGQSGCSGIAVSNSASAICQLLTAPQLEVTQLCPPGPVGPGGLLAFTGTVRNLGNITLDNVVVTNSRTGNTPLLSVASLAPGATATFTGSYSAPAVGPASSTSIAHATSLCGASVTDAATSVCALLTTPGLQVTKLCPPGPVLPGGLLTFTGTLTNTGNVALTNVFVVNSQPSPNTPVIGPIILLPGAGTTFSGSYLAPTNACEVTDILTARGSSSATGLVLTNSASATCQLLTGPAISVMENCPPGPVLAGAVVAYDGVVRNLGDVTLTNVFVFSLQPTNRTQVLGPITLAPGQSAPFNGTYVALAGSNPVTNSTIVTNFTGTISTNVATVITSTNAVVVTGNPGTPTSFGSFSAVARVPVDHFAIGSGFTGLTYAGEDHGYGATEFYSMRRGTAGITYFDTIIASTGTTTDRFDAGTRNFGELAYASPDLGFGPVIFYYLSHDAVGTSTFGSITPGGVVGVVADHFVAGAAFDALTFTATDVGFGANLFYYIRHDVSGLSTFGTINPALPGTMTDRFTVGTNVHSLTFTDLIAPGFGPNSFYYLRDDANGQTTFGTIFVTGLTTAAVTDRFTVGTNATELAFTPTDVGFGPNRFYFLRGRAPSLSTNLVPVFHTNLVVTRTTNTVTVLTTNSVVRFTPTNTVVATGMDLCQGRTVAVAANCLGPVAVPQDAGMPSIDAGTGSNGIRLSFPTEAGKQHTVQFKEDLGDPAWTDLKTVIGTGGKVILNDSAEAGSRTRFYRIIPTLDPARTLLENSQAP